MDPYILHGQVFWQAYCAVRYRLNSSSSAIMDLRMGREQKQRQTLAERLIHKVCSKRHAILARLHYFVWVYETSQSPGCLPILPCFSLCASSLNLRVTTSLLSVGFLGLQTLQFAAQGNNLVGFALIIFLWSVLATSATFGCSSKRIRARMGSARRIWPLNDRNLFNWADKMTLLDQAAELVENFGYLKPSSHHQLPASPRMDHQFQIGNFFFQGHDKYNFEFATAAEDTTARLLAKAKRWKLAVK